MNTQPQQVAGNPEGQGSLGKSSIANNAWGRVQAVKDGRNNRKVNRKLVNCRIIIEKLADQAAEDQGDGQGVEEHQNRS